MSQEQPPPAQETDERFPSGAWRGFFVQTHHRPGRHEMELDLQFAKGQVRGEGRDYVGTFDVRGTYEVESGECRWTKTYRRMHSVHYSGVNEGKGIWGLWDIPPSWKGGFHIWPKAWGDSPFPSDDAAEELPLEVEEDELVTADEELVPAGGGFNLP